MEKVLLTLKMPHTSYVGGIATIINSYINKRELFEENGYYPEVFDYQSEKIDHFPVSKVSNVLYGIAQGKALSKKISHEISSGNDIIVHIHTSCRYLFYKDVLLAKHIKRKYGVKVILSIHVGHINTVFDGIPASFKTSSIQYINDYVDKVLFLSGIMMQQFIDAGVNKNKVETLFNFHDLPYEVNEGVVNTDVLTKKGLNLLFVGAIKREKGILELLEAVNSIGMQDIHLDVCGQLTDSSIESDFQRMVSENPEIELHGYVKGKEKQELYEKADVLILPSYHEGFPLVVLEALASGTAIISTKVGTTPEVLTNDNVDWVNIGDVESLKNAIEDLYYNREKLIKMQITNRNIGEQYSSAAHIYKLCEIYEKCN